MRHAVEFFSTAEPTEKRLYAAPTGTGKSVVILAVQAQVGEGCWVVTPRLEIVAGLLDKLGLAVAPMGDRELVETAWARRITTPIRLRSALLAGTMPEPRQLLLDEGHHDLAATWQDLHLLCGNCPAAAYTATPYRGTPKGTLAMREQWGEPVWILTYPEAAERGVIAVPSAIVWPLVDDDVIEIERGELVAARVEAETKLRLDHVADKALSFVTEEQLWDTPTMFSLPSRDLSHDLAARLGDRGMSAVAVTGETPFWERQAAFQKCLDRAAALVQIDVVSEGVDLPIRRLIDLRPTLSPVKWLQQLGRITRPGGASEYICTNRNLLRHGYLLEGCLPTAAMKAGLAAFGGPGKRSASRAVGLEAIGRFKPAALPLADGLVAISYSVSVVEEFARRDYFVIVHPLRAEPLWATRTNLKGVYQYAWGKWTKCDPPTDLTGFGSTTSAPLTDKMADWWHRSAKRHGLDPEAQITRHQFAALPVLADIRGKL